MCGGRAGLEQKMFQMANKKFPGKYKSKNFYMNAKRFRETAPNYVCEDGEWQGMNVWNAVCTAFLKYGDFGHPNAIKAPAKAVSSAYDVLSVLGDKPRGNICFRQSRWRLVGL